MMDLGRLKQSPFDADPGLDRTLFGAQEIRVVSQTIIISDPRNTPIKSLRP